MAWQLGLPIGSLSEVRLTAGRGIRKIAASLPEIAWEDVWQGAQDARLLPMREQPGNSSLAELVVTIMAAKACSARRIFEFGTFDGRTSLHLALNIPDAEVFTIDLPASSIDTTKFALSHADRLIVGGHEIGSRMAGAPQVRQLYGDTATFDFSPFLGTCDLVFVDAAHTYDYVAKDSQSALALLRKAGGIILWHDYGVWEGVTAALNDLARTDARFSAIRRVAGTSLALLRVGGDPRPA